MRSNSPLVRGSGTDMNAAMTPMIDIVFLLLVFFVWTASFQSIEYIMPPSELSSQLGTEASDINQPPPSDFEEIVIRIRNQDGAPAWSVRSQTMVSLDQVRVQLEKLAAINPSVVVILHPDPDVQLGHVIGGYDTALTAGFANISFAVN